MCRLKTGSGSDVYKWIAKPHPVVDRTQHNRVSASAQKNRLKWKEKGVERKSSRIVVSFVELPWESFVILLSDLSRIDGAIDVSTARWELQIRVINFILGRWTSDALACCGVISALWQGFVSQNDPVLCFIHSFIHSLFLSSRLLVFNSTYLNSSLDSQYGITSFNNCNSHFLFQL